MTFYCPNSPLLPLNFSLDAPVVKNCRKMLVVSQDVSSSRMIGESF